jgi:putative PIN family toxin of toxin-antitoxin system
LPEQALRKAFKTADIYASPELLKEYRDTPLKLEASGKITHAQLKALIAGIASFVSKAKIVYPTKKLLLCRDPKDNMVLECCLAAKATHLITGDKDLLEIGETPFDLKIVTPHDFMKSGTA